MQLSSKDKSVKQSVNKIIEKEGYSGLYKGAVSPVIGTAPIVATLFATNDFSKRTIKQYNLNQFLKEFLPGC